jgi:hypothetical protein
MTTSPPIPSLDLIRIAIALVIRAPAPAGITATATEGAYEGCRRALPN